MRFIHLSDLHFHRNPQDNMAATTTLAFVKENYPDHYLIVSGDIVDDGHEDQYKRAYEALVPFTEPGIFISPGNHDFGAAGSFYSRERAERFDKFLSEPLHQGGTFTGDATPVVNIVQDNTGRVMLIALDSNLETDHPFDFSCGCIGEEQLGFLDTILLGCAADMVKMLFFHHHPFMRHDPFMELKDARDLMRLIYGRVHLLLFGHRHVSEQWENRNNIPYILAADNAPGKAYAREITIENGMVRVSDISIAQHDRGRRPREGKSGKRVA
jgi:3',5'-cyclic AMP phosphodiesterase CpdA